MAQKITLIEYNENTYAGDDMDPDIQYRDFHPCVSGTKIVPAEPPADIEETARRIEDMRNYAYVISSSSSEAAESLFEHYSDEDTIVDWSTPFWQGNFSADFPYQTFTPQVTHTMTKGRLYLKKADATAVTLWSFGIFATDITGAPTGLAIAGMFESNPTIAQTPFDWQWVDFVLPTGIELASGVVYAMRFGVQLSGAAKTFYWARRGSDVYSRGQIWHWVWRWTPETPAYPGALEDGVAEGDHFFEEWGYEL